jgi:F0F1-type ATP synthase epsilon subunit
MKDFAGELLVVVATPDEQIWEGKAESVSSENSAGTFDILPQHANFVTMIKGKPIIVRTQSDGEKTFTYKNAVITVKEDKVSIYTDI